MKKINVEESGSLTTNGFFTSPITNSQDVIDSLVSNEHSDLLGDISNNQKQTSCLTNDDNNVLTDTHNEQRRKAIQETKRLAAEPLKAEKATPNHSVNV